MCGKVTPTQILTNLSKYFYIYPCISSVHGEENLETKFLRIISFSMGSWYFEKTVLF